MIFNEKYMKAYKYYVPINFFFFNGEFFSRPPDHHLALSGGPTEDLVDRGNMTTLDSSIPYIYVDYLIFTFSVPSKTYFSTTSSLAHTYVTVRAKLFQKIVSHCAIKHTRLQHINDIVIQGICSVSYVPGHDQLGVTTRGVLVLLFNGTSL